MERVFLWFKNREGATAVEYGIIVAAIAVAFATAVFLAGGTLSNIFQILENVASHAATNAAG